MVIQQAFVQLHAFHPEKVSDFINKTEDLPSGKHTKNELERSTMLLIGKLTIN
jgi:hypothetical protein